MHLVAERVSHAYGSLTVLDRIDLEVASGEIVALLGPSGCGKSTLLRLLGGLERPASGRVLTRGVPPTASLNPLTYVFQDFALVPWRTVEQNVSLALEHHPLSSAARAARVASALERVGLAEFSGLLPKQLSGGMRQRTAIARALAVDPAVLLMDEPLSALDAQTRILLMDDLVRLWTETRFTAVYVTHNVSEAIRLAHRVVVLSRRPGRIREIVAIETPIAERTEDAPAIAAASRRIWDLIATEARAADREVVHGS